MLTVTNVLRRLPPDVAATLREPVQEVLTIRTGNLLWFGALVGLWTATSFVETIRDILRRAYGVKYCAPFWEYRLGSILLILGAVLLLMVAFAASAALTLAHHFIVEWFPLAQNIGHTLGLYRLVPAVTLFGTFYLLFLALTPSRYRMHGCKKWPGALFITAWWLGTVEILPSALALFGGYTRTYGSLAGVMIALIFFFVVGLGVVIGAELNAALAESGATALKGEIYTGPYTDELEVEEPQPGEDVKPELETGGPQL
jgi:membrane protein